MTAQKFYYDKNKPCTTYRNGSVSYLTPGPFASLAAVHNCPCDDGKARTAYCTNYGDSYWTIGACISVSGKTITGFLTCDENGYHFHANQYGKNFLWLDVNYRYEYKRNILFCNIINRVNGHRTDIAEYLICNNLDIIASYTRDLVRLGRKELSRRCKEQSIIL